jgi:hypothetical protein
MTIADIAYAPQRKLKTATQCRYTLKHYTDNIEIMMTGKQSLKSK